MGGGPTISININDESVFIVNDDLTSVAKMFIWLKPLSQSADDTTIVLTAFVRLDKAAGGSLFPVKPVPFMISIYSRRPLLVVASNSFRWNRSHKKTMSSCPYVNVEFVGHCKGSSTFIALNSASVF